MKVAEPRLVTWFAKIESSGCRQLELGTISPQTENEGKSNYHLNATILFLLGQITKPPLPVTIHPTKLEISRYWWLYLCSLWSIKSEECSWSQLVQQLTIGEMPARPHHPPSTWLIYILSPCIIYEYCIENQTKSSLFCVRLGFISTEEINWLLQQLLLTSPSDALFANILNAINPVWKEVWKDCTSEALQSQQLDRRFNWEYVQC